MKYKEKNGTNKKARREELKKKLDKLDAICRALHKKEAKLQKEGKSTGAIEKQIGTNSTKAN